MTVNLEKLEVGSIVTFRNGYSLPVTRAVCDGMQVRIQLMGLENLVRFWYLDGRSGEEIAQLDIVSVKPPEFDWATVESGMAFNCGCVVWYIGRDFEDDDRVIVSHNKDCAGFSSTFKSSLTRSPEHDIKVGG